MSNLIGIPEQYDVELLTDETNQQRAKRIYDEVYDTKLSKHVVPFIEEFPEPFMIGLEESDSPNFDLRGWQDIQWQ